MEVVTQVGMFGFSLIKLTYWFCVSYCLSLLVVSYFSEKFSEMTEVRTWSDAITIAVIGFIPLFNILICGGMTLAVLGNLNFLSKPFGRKKGD